MEPIHVEKGGGFLVDQTETKWLLDQAQQLAQQATTYQQKAFYVALGDLIREQQKRADQLENELDGRMWEH